MCAVKQFGVWPMRATINDAVDDDDVDSEWWAAAARLLQAEMDLTSTH